MTLKPSLPKISSTTAFAAPDTLAWDKYPWPEGVTWFARGVGAARRGDAEAAQTAIARLTQLEAAAAASGEDLFARSIRVLRLAVEGWRAQAQGDTGRARDLLTQAAALEAATPKHAVTPGPTLPASRRAPSRTATSGS